MPETVITDKYVDQIPRFNLPKEFSNEPKPEVPAELPKEEAKPATEAVATETPKAEEVKVEEDKETTGKDPEKASTRRFERRIDRAIRARAEAQAKAEVLERENAELKAKQAPSVSPDAPKMENYTDIQEYAKAYAAYEKDNAIKDYEKKQRETTQQRELQKLSEDWEVKARRADSKYEDFDEVVGDLKPTSPWAQALMEEDNGEDVAYYLGKHQAEARKIFALSPLSQAREIGKLSAKLSAQPEKPKTPSKAPAPITPVQGTAEVSDTEYTPGMSFEKYRKIGDKMFRGRS